MAKEEIKENIVNKIEEKESDVTAETESGITFETESDMTAETESDITAETESGMTIEKESKMPVEAKKSVTEESENIIVPEIFDDAYTQETYETSEDVTDVELTIASESNLEENASTSKHLSPKDLLSLEGRHIKAEDFEWGKCPVKSLADMIIEAVREIEGSDLEKFLKNATSEQLIKIFELLPLDLPLEITMPIIDDEIYWKRMCLGSWPIWDVWRYSDSWKLMFAQRSVRNVIEKFIPDKENIQDLCKNLRIFSKYVNFLQISILRKTTPKKLEIDIDSEYFDQELDDAIRSRDRPVYLDFEKVFACFPLLKSLTITLSPECTDFENFYFNDVDFNCLFTAIRNLNELQKLRLSNGNFTNEQLSKILTMLLSHCTLKELNFSFNFIDDDTCYHAAKLLISKVPLELLNLRYNKITDKGAIVIASALFAKSRLKKLDLSLNMIGDDGAVAIAKALVKNEDLTDFDLSKNKITEQGGIAFAELIKKSKILRSLRLQENFLGEKAGKEIAEAIKENNYLLELDVRFCGFQKEDEGFIHRAILQNRSKVPYSTYVKNDEDTSASEFLF